MAELGFDRSGLDTTACDGRSVGSAGALRRFDADSRHSAHAASRDDGDGSVTDLHERAKGHAHQTGRSHPDAHGAPGYRHA